MADALTIGHLADLHVTEGPRFETAQHVLRWIVEDGRARGVGGWLVVGDLAGTQCPHRATPAERNLLAETFQAMAALGPVVIVLGNHDQEDDVLIYGRLKAEHPITVVTRPAAIAHFCMWDDREGVPLFCMPYPRKGWAVGSGQFGGTVAEQKAAIEDGIRAILAGWRAEIAARPSWSRAPILAAYHGNVAGSIVGGGEVMIGCEIEMARHDLEELGVAYGALGHIHKRQSMAPGWWYPGSPFAQNYGEAEEPHGYHLVTLPEGAPAVVEFRETPGPKLVTVDVAWAQRDDGTWGWQQEAAPVTAGAEVRVRVTIPEDAVAAAPIDQLEAAVRATGAADVRIDRHVVPTTRVRSTAIAAARTAWEKVAAYLDTLADPPSPEVRERLRAKLAMIEAGEDAGREAA